VEVRTFRAKLEGDRGKYRRNTLSGSGARLLAWKGIINEPGCGTGTAAIFTDTMSSCRGKGEPTQGCMKGTVGRDLEGPW